MKIELIKLKFNDTYSYKYKPFKYCCDELKSNRGIVFTNEDLNDLGGEYEDKDGCSIPQICTSHTEIITSYEDEWEQTDNYPIQFCPHCGEEIEISVVNKIDLSEKYKKTVQKRKQLWKESQLTDSKREEQRLKEQVHQLDNQINDYYLLSEYDPNFAE